MPLSTSSTLSSPSNQPLTPPFAAPLPPLAHTFKLPPRDSPTTDDSTTTPFSPPRPYALPTPLVPAPKAADPSIPLPPFLSRIYATHRPPINASPIAGPSQPLPLYLGPPAVPVVEEDLVPPENFAMVTEGVYRCGFPKRKNFAFMETLGLKTVL